jgi:MSHA pilin protein MshC
MMKWALPTLKISNIKLHNFAPHCHMLKTISVEIASQPRSHPAGASAMAQRGFTLIELIMVMVMLGVLAAVAAPKIFDVSAFNARGFHDQTMAYLRFAQKTAVAQRRTVCVSFSSSSLTLSIAAATGSYDCASAATLTGPQGESPVLLSAKSSVSYGTVPAAAFSFDALGQPISSTGLAVSPVFKVNGVGDSIMVEASTGYVHE